MKELVLIGALTPTLFIIYMMVRRARKAIKENQQYVELPKFDPIPRAMRDKELFEVINNEKSSFEDRRACEKELQRRGLLAIII